MTLDMIANHLWQSTLCVGVAWLLTLALRKNHAGVRFWVWFTASMKFLVPFAALVALGSYVPWKPAPVSPSDAVEIFENVSRPFSQADMLFAQPQGAPEFDARTAAATVLPVIWGLGTILVLTVWAIRWRRVARLVRQGITTESGPVAEALRRVEARMSTRPMHPARLTRPIRLRASRYGGQARLALSNASLEPGVIGWFRPVLLWPHGISARLTDAQLESILAHELAHVQRRDNLTAAIHMLVEAVFWFHPGVWWIGARLVDERERACDEAVVHLSGERHAYAEGILRTCEYHHESPLPCVSGVTGSDLKKRIEAIMRRAPVTTLTRSGQLLVAGVATVMVAVPVGLGVVTATHSTQSAPASTQTHRRFDVVSVKPNKSGDTDLRLDVLPGGRFLAMNIPLKQFIRAAYALQLYQIENAPSWTNSERFDITAMMPADLAAKPLLWTPGKYLPMQLMMQSVLTDHFGMVARVEERESQGYALVLGSESVGASKLTPAAVPCTPACGVNTIPGKVTARNVPLQQFAELLSQLTGRLVVNASGLSGNFDFALTWASESQPTTTDAPSLFTALQEQLGLRLESRRMQTPILVIDTIERPSDNNASASPPPRQAIQAGPDTSQPIVPVVAGGKPAFDVASIKINNNPDGPVWFSAPAPGRVLLINQSVRQLIYNSYSVQEHQVIGGSDWLRTVRFDVEATAEGAPSQSQMLPMIRTLLADRFHLVMHTESRQLPIYRLVVARGDRRLGSRLRPSVCEWAWRGPGPNIRGVCGNSGGRGSMISQGINMRNLAAQLGRPDRGGLDRPVVNETGLDGTFDLELTWSPDAPPGTSQPPDAVSIFTALEEQLGLKLLPAMGPVDVMVIDRVSRPTEN